MANGNGIASVEHEVKEPEVAALAAASPNEEAKVEAVEPKKEVTLPVTTTVTTTTVPVPDVPPPLPPPAPKLIDQVDTLSAEDREALIAKLGLKPPAPPPPAAAHPSGAMSFAQKIVEVQEGKNAAAAAAAAATPPTPPTPQVAEDPWRRRPREMAKLRPPFYVWTIDAIEKSKYEFEVEPGKKEIRYRPIYGLMLQRFLPAGEGTPAVIFMLFQKTFASDVDGRVLEAEEGKHVLVTCNHNLRQLLPILKSASEQGGVALISITPTGYHTLADGTKDMTFDAEIEPDESNKLLPRVFSRESAVGELKKNFEALR